MRDHFRSGGNLRLAGKVAIVTGAGSGIGKATALLFAREGARVVAATNEAADLAPLEEAARGLVALEVDVSREDDVRRLVRATVDTHGGIDILVNNAGVEQPGDVTEATEEHWQRLMDVNLKSVFLCSKHVVPEMRKRGKGAIVNNASINGIRGNHRLVVYSASKGGVVAMTRAMALDHGAENIRVNCVCPATIEGTRMHVRSIARAADAQAATAQLVAKHPMGRLGKPEEVAAAILFLASDEASFITGVTLPIDGGRSIR